MEKKIWKPRLTIEVTEYQYNIIKKHLEHGQLKQIFGVIIEDVVTMLEKYGMTFILALITRRISMRDYINGNDRGTKDTEYQ